VTEHDVLVGYRLRLFTVAEELGNVSAACRAMDVDRSTYYRLKKRVDRWGLEALNVRERRRPRMPNQIGPHLEQRIIALRPRSSRLRAQTHQRRAGPREVGRPAHQRARRMARRAQGRAEHPRQAPGVDRPPPRPLPTPARAAAARAPHRRHQTPGEKVQLDCFYVSRLSGTKGTVWQDTAIDVASAFCWAELHTSKRNPRSRHTRELLHRIARELAHAGWKLQQVTTDNGSEFRARDFQAAVTALGARQRFIQAGRPNSNGCVQRVQLTILEECWRPAFARSLVPKMTALSQDLDEYPQEYNTDRAHTGSLTQGRVPADIVYGARKTTTVR
jgi:transposase InsO family protein